MGVFVDKVRDRGGVSKKEGERKGNRKSGREGGQISGSGLINVQMIEVPVR